MDVNIGRALLTLGMAAGTLGLGACTTDRVDAETAGLRGPIEARGPATAAGPEVSKAELEKEEPPPVLHHDRERDRWYFYDERRQIYRWENGEPKT